MNMKREQILQAARRILTTEGSAGFSLRKVAQFAGMSLGNLQYHYPTRRAVLDGLLAADVEQYRRVFDSMQTSTEKGPVLLHRFLLDALHDASRRDELAVFRALFAFNEPEINASLERYYLDLYELLEQGLARLSDRPVKSPGVRKSAALLFPYLEGYETTFGYLTLDAAEIAALLAESVWSVLMA